MIDIVLNRSFFISLGLSWNFLYPYRLCSLPVIEILSLCPGFPLGNRGPDSRSLDLRPFNDTTKSPPRMTLGRRSQSPFDKCPSTGWSPWDDVLSGSSPRFPSTTDGPRRHRWYVTSPVRDHFGLGTSLYHDLFGVHDTLCSGPLQRPRRSRSRTSSVPTTSSVHSYVRSKFFLLGKKDTEERSWERTVWNCSMVNFSSPGKSVSSVISHLNLDSPLFNY